MLTFFELPLGVLSLRDPPGLPESGAALRAAALALSAKAIAIQAQRLKELRAASQTN